MNDVINLTERRKQRDSGVVTTAAKAGSSQVKPTGTALCTPLPPYPRYVPPELTESGEGGSPPSDNSKSTAVVSLNSVVRLGLPIIESEIYELEKSLALVKKDSDNSSKAIPKLQNSIRVLKTFCGAVRSTS